MPWSQASSGSFGPTVDSNYINHTYLVCQQGCICFSSQCEEGSANQPAHVSTACTTLLTHTSLTELSAEFSVYGRAIQFGITAGQRSRFWPSAPPAVTHVIQDLIRGSGVAYLLGDDASEGSWLGSGNGSPPLHGKGLT